MGRYKPKIKKKCTIKVTPDSQLVNILQVVAVSGEIGERSLRLFGLNGKKYPEPKTNWVKAKMLSDVTYIDNQKTELYSGVAFNRRGTGIEKTLRMSQNASDIFKAVPGGEYYNRYYKKANMPSDRSHVLRNVNLAKWCIFCSRADVEFNPMFNPTLYDLSKHYNIKAITGTPPTGEAEDGKRAVEKSMFYPSREIYRRDGAGRLCCKGSRVTGNLVKPEGVFVCYSIPKTRMVWRAFCERTMLEYTKSCFGVRNFDIPYEITQKPDALCIAESYEDAEQVVFAPPFSRTKGKTTRDKRMIINEAGYLPENDYSELYTPFRELFAKVCVFPSNEDGVKQFQYFIIPNVYKKTLKAFVDSPKEERAALSCSYECDSYCKDLKVATLFFFDGCVTRLKKCAEKLNSCENGKKLVKVQIVCFPWQEEYVRKIMGTSNNYTVFVEDFEETYDSVLNAHI